MDPEGSPWPVTYRCVPARYSYEFRAGWRALAAAWDLGAGDSVTLTRAGSDRLKLSLQVPWFFSTPLFGGFFPPLSLVVFSTPFSGGFFPLLSLVVFFQFSLCLQPCTAVIPTATKLIIFSRNLTWKPDIVELCGDQCCDQ